MITKLKDTVELMTSPDHRERFLGEYYQNKIRLDKLQAMIDKWDKDGLNFTPTCPRETYEFQLSYMKKLDAILIMRAKMEGINLE
jgi:hypothetical protein